MTDSRQGSDPDLEGRSRLSVQTIDAAAVELETLAPAAVEPRSAESRSGAASSQKPAVGAPEGTAARRLGAGGSPIAAMALGMIALITALASLWYAIEHPDGAGDLLRTRVAGLEAAQHDGAATASAQSGKLDELSVRIAQFAAAEASRPSVGADAPLATKLSVLEAEVKRLAAQVDELDRRVRDAADAAQSANARAKSFADQVSKQEKSGLDRTTQQDGENAIRLAQVSAQLADLRSALTSLQAQVAQQSAADMTLRRAVISAAVRAAVERGNPFAAELDTARKASLDPAALATLEPFADSGVPNENRLFRELSALVPQLLRASAPLGQQPDHPTDETGLHDDHHSRSYIDRLQTGLEKLVRIRPVGEMHGDDPAVVIGRIDVAMMRRDFAGVEAELDKLPPPAQNLAEPWRAKVHARNAAIATARQLAVSSLTEIAQTSTPVADYPPK